MNRREAISSVALLLGGTILGAEAFLSGCLPITWVDSNVLVDFNPQAMVNLQGMIGHGFEGLNELLHDEQHLQQYADQPLIINTPSIEPYKDFIRKILAEVRSA